MKISVNWMKQFLDFELPAIDELVAKIGSQLGEVEEVIDIGKKYQGIVVVKVVECEKHPNADKLNICKIDDDGKIQNIERDENGFVQVVCGAPNVRKDLLVAWLPPGSTVPSSFDKDPFVLETRDLRGKKSNGMLASPKELAISDEHDGILEIDKDAQPGSDFAALYELDDYIIDIENKMFTHRPDCFGVLGVAREVAGILGKPFQEPDWYWQLPIFGEGEGLQLEVFNDAQEKVPRFMAVVLKNVDVKTSPLWLQVALAKLGQKSINNVVDLTNFYMQLTAQPLHTYDYDTLRGKKLGARFAKQDEKITLLNRKTYQLHVDDIVIADDKGAVGLAGIMGGGESEVTDKTRNIVIECANFDMYAIRKSSMRHGLFTDAVTRFNKGQSPLQCDRVLAKIMEAIQHSAHAELASQVFDIKKENDAYDSQTLSGTLSVATSFINARLGLDLSDEAVSGLLRNVHFACFAKKAEQLAITAPFWRTDIGISEDIVEEVGRLYGYDRLPLELPKRTIAPVNPDESLRTKDAIRSTLAGLGANEVLNYSFVHGDLLTNVGQDPSQAFQISNALSPDLQYYRFHGLPSLLEKVHPNIKAGYDEFALFELAKGHNLRHKDDDDGVPKELEFLDFVYAKKTSQPGDSAAFYQARHYLDGLADSFGLTLEYAPIEKDPDVPVAKPFELSRSAYVSLAGSQDFLGIVGEFRHGPAQKLKLPPACAGFSIGWEVLMMHKLSSRYQALSRFPSVIQDVCLEVSQDISYQQLTSHLNTSLQAAVSDRETVRFVPIDLYSSDAIAGKTRTTYRIEISHYNKTLTAGDVSALIGKALSQLAQAVSVTQI